MYALLWLATATPTPSPSPTLIDPDRVTPGVAGFIGIAVIAIAVVLLLIDMQRRIRRARYRSEIAEQLDAEAADVRDDDADGTSLNPPRPAKE